MDATRVPRGRSPGRQTAAAHAPCRKAPPRGFSPENKNAGLCAV